MIGEQQSSAMFKEIPFFLESLQYTVCRSTLIDLLKGNASFQKLCYVHSDGKLLIIISVFLYTNL